MEKNFGGKEKKNVKKFLAGKNEEKKFEEEIVELKCSLALLVDEKKKLEDILNPIEKSNQLLEIKNKKLEETNVKIKLENTQLIQQLKEERKNTEISLKFVEKFKIESQNLINQINNISEYEDEDFSVKFR